MLVDYYFNGRPCPNAELKAALDDALSPLPDVAAPTSIDRDAILAEAAMDDDPEPKVAPFAKSINPRDPDYAPSDDDDGEGSADDGDSDGYDSGSGMVDAPGVAVAAAAVASKPSTSEEDSETDPDATESESEADEDVEMDDEPVDASSSAAAVMAAAAASRKSRKPTVAPKETPDARKKRILASYGYTDASKITSLAAAVPATVVSAAASAAAPQSAAIVNTAKPVVATSAPPAQVPSAPAKPVTLAVDPPAAAAVAAAPVAATSLRRVVPVRTTVDVDADSLPLNDDDDPQLTQSQFPTTNPFAHAQPQQLSGPTLTTSQVMALYDP